MAIDLKGTGAIPVGVRNALGLPTSPMLYGAVGDGVTDDTAAVTAALAASTHVRLNPTKTFLVDQIVVPADTTLDVSHATLKLKSGTGNPLIRANAGSAVVGAGVLDCALGTDAGVVIQGDDVTVSDVTIVSPSTKGITATNRARSKVINVTVSDPDADGIYFENTSGAEIAGPTITGCRVDRSAQAAGSTDMGIKVYGGPTNGFTGAKVQGCTVLMSASETTGSMCIEVTRGTGAIVEGNTCSGGRMGVSIATAVGASVSGNTITGPSKYGVELASSTYCTVTGNTISMDGAGTDQVAVVFAGSASSYCTVSGNTIKGLSTSGAAIAMSLTGSPLHTAIVGNIIEVPNDSGALGINLATGARYVTITGNTLRAAGSSAYAGVQNLGCSDVTITGNTVTGFANCVVLGGGATIDRCAVTGNSGDVVPFLGTSSATIGVKVLARGNSDEIAVIGELATDFSNSTTGSFTSIVTAAIVPTGTAVAVTVAGNGVKGSDNEADFFQCVMSGGGSATKSLGAVVGTANQQYTFGGVLLFTGLTPGTSYTFDVQHKPAAGTFSCRVSSFPQYEQCRILLQHA